MQTHEITDSKARNVAVRKGIAKIVEDNGMSYTFISKQVGTSLSSFSQWRTGVYNYAEPNLKKVESIIKKYSFND